MSGARSAIDVMTAEDTALLDSMRNETEAPEVEVVDAPEAEPDDAPEAAEAAETEAEAPADGKPQSRYTKRVFELTEKARVAEEARIAAEKKAAVAEGVVAERMRLLTEAAQAAMQQSQPVAPPPPAIEIPDINTDPVGHFRAKLEIAEKRDAERDAILQGFAQQQEQARQAQEMWDWGRASEAAFSATEPSYVEATQFMLERRKTQLAAIGITDPAAQQQIIKNDIMQIAMKSRAENVNFGERMYRVAESYGYQKKAAEPEKPAIPSLEAGLPAADRAAVAERGRANSTTIANVGASTPLRLTPDSIANMPEAQFLKYVEEIKAKGGSALRDLLGH